MPAAGALVTTAPSMWPELVRDDADRRTRALAGALAEYGLDPSRRAAVVARPTPEAIVALAAAGLCGSRPILVDPGMSDAALGRVLAEARPAFVLAGGEDNLRRVIDLRPDLDSVELVFALVEPKEGPPLPAWSIASLVEGEGLATGDGAPDPGLEVVGADGVRRNWAPADLARRVGETLGSTKASTRDVVLLRLRPTDAGWAPVLGAALAGGARVVVDAPGAGSLAAAFGAHRPTLAFVEARELDGFRRESEAAVAARSWFHRRIHAWAIEKGSASETGPAVRRIADRLVLTAWRERTGGRIRTIRHYGGSIDPATARFFSALGLPMEAAVE